MTDDDNFWNDTTIQNIRLDDSSELKYVSSEGINTGFPYVINQVNLNEGNTFMGNKSRVDTDCMIQAVIYLYY